MFSTVLRLLGVVETSYTKRERQVTVGQVCFRGKETEE